MARALLVLDLCIASLAHQLMIAARDVDEDYSYIDIAFFMADSKSLRPMHLETRHIRATHFSLIILYFCFVESFYLIMVIVIVKELTQA